VARMLVVSRMSATAAFKMICDQEHIVFVLFPVIQA
jgi:hypothetical protein